MVANHVLLLYNSFRNKMKKLEKKGRQMAEHEFKHIPWEREEILLFMNAFADDILKVSGKKKKDRIERLSKLFRERGLQLGYDVYPSFRNAKSIESMFYGAKKYIQTGDSMGVHPLLTELIDLFRNNRSAYDAELVAIPRLTVDKDNEPSVPQTKVGNYGVHFLLCDILDHKSEILRTLRKNYTRVSDFKLEKSEKESWASSLSILRAAYLTLGPAFGHLDVVMEYVLPRFKPGTKKSLTEHPIRADVLMVSSKTVLILEFKRRNAEFESGYVMQAGKYQTRIQRFHAASSDMIIKSIVVLTEEKNHVSSFGNVASCSADKLGDVIGLMFEPNPQTHPSFEEWINSEFHEE